jgi:regulator of sigma D
MEHMQTGTGGAERRVENRSIKDKLTSERADVLVAFCRLAGVDPYDDPDNQPEFEERLQSFCQILVDYLAAGHFGLYQRIIEGKERRKEISELAEKLYQGIAETTEHALDFNDKYDSAHHHDINNDFNNDLSALGESLATRIELEDNILSALR